jgi:hypothetical protein
MNAIGFSVCMRSVLAVLLGSLGDGVSSTPKTELLMKSGYAYVYVSRYHAALMQFLVSAPTRASEKLNPSIDPL